MENNRRRFIKNAGKLAVGLGLGNNIIDPLLSVSAEEFTISILQTTDVHCQVHPHDELFWEDGKMVFRKAGGYAKLAGYFKKARKANPDTFIIDTGDMFQGSELSVKTTGKAMVPMLNKLNYDLYLPGNWEVIYYKQAMESLFGSLNAPAICANMYHGPGESRKGNSVFKPYYVWNVRGTRIGFIGYTDPFVPVRQSPGYSKGIVYSKPGDNLAYYIDLLRNRERCAYILLLAHLGLSQQVHLANSPECNGVDYILGGDTHERVRKPIQCKYARVVEPGAFGSFVGKLDLTVNNGKVIKDHYELVEITASKFEPDAEMTALIRENEKPFAQSINKIIGYSTIPLYRNFIIENTIDTLILNALQWQMKEIDIILSNGFRFCPPRATPDHTGNIPVTEGYLFDMLPVDSAVRTANVSGRQLKDWLEEEFNNVFSANAAERFGGWVIKFKGMEVRFYAFTEKGNRVKEVTVGNLPLNPDKIYSVSACERDGDPAEVLCRIKGVTDARNTDFSLHDVIRNYLAGNSPVTPAPLHAAKILDAPQTLLTQVHGLDYEFQ